MQCESENNINFGLISVWDVINTGLNDECQRLNEICALLVPGEMSQLICNNSATCMHSKMPALPTRKIAAKYTQNV